MADGGAGDGEYTAPARLGSLYDVLEVAPDASEAALLRGYKRVAGRYHPSRTTHALSRSRFERACVAYRVLRDREVRKEYDYDGQERWGRSEGAEAEAFFCEVHGGCPARGGQRKPRDTVVELALPLGAYYNGRTTKLVLKRTRLCPQCEGLGIPDERLRGLCADCRGKGCITHTTQRAFLTRGMAARQATATCPTCQGTGVTVSPKDRCTRCRGERTVAEQKHFNVVVEKGMGEGDHFVFPGEGDELPEHVLPGDAFVVLTESKHESFRRVGANLVTDTEISLADALTGFHLVFSHLDGRQLIVQPTRGTVVSPNKKWQVVGEGMPHRGDPSQMGHLVINVTVTFPSWITSEVSSKLARLLSKPPQQVVLEEGFQERTLVAADPGVLSEREGSAHATKGAAPVNGDAPGGDVAACVQQ
eukprot:TRINITY_DN22872_c0_g1_i1.p1 TRINITY_DN22872_c0_g1~~TRINITY_DN22872_c0_g1_i1.p1  ORF type:complete len:419 (+),score=123.24 TRINITY_DN22872_c0_g1_i1:88-1344(+)